MLQFKNICVGHYETDTPIVVTVEHNGVRMDVALDSERSAQLRTNATSLADRQLHANGVTYGEKP